MPYVDRENGSIVGAYSCQQRPGQEFLPDNSPEVVQFVGRLSLRTEALSALAKSDITILRCFEHGVPVPEAWQVYRDELRAIVSGASSASELPERPEYPEGT